MFVDECPRSPTAQLVEAVHVGLDAGPNMYAPKGAGPLKDVGAGYVFDVYT